MVQELQEHFGSGQSYSLIQVAGRRDLRRIVGRGSPQKPLINSG
jgi:hypothetical protein